MTEDDRKEWMGTEDHLAGLKPGPAAYNAGCRCAKCKKLNKDRQDRYQEKLRERERRERLVAEWHDAKPGDPAHGTELHDWLGMTKDQYQEWVTSDKLPGDSA
jgi:hypothetical protein